jgi:hypothetical protein
MNGDDLLRGNGGARPSRGNLLGSWEASLGHRETNFPWANHINPLYFHPMGLKAVPTPDALDGTRADIDDLCHHGGGPVGRHRGRVALGERHDALGDVGRQRRDVRRPRLVAQEAVISFLHEALLPAPDTDLRFAGPANDLTGANTVRAQQDDLSPPDMLLGALRFRVSTFRRRQSAGLRVMEIPVRMRQTRMRPVRWESLRGFKCQTRSATALFGVTFLFNTRHQSGPG